MLPQSKTTQQAIGAISRLAEVYPQADVWLSASDIAEARSLRKSATAKVLSVLAREHLVTGSPGPGGGYRLSKRPGDITLWDVVRLFDRDAPMACPYGPNWCGNQEPCPMHDSLAALQKAVESYLRATTFDAFAHHRRPEQAPRRGQTARG